ncbi:hypothetical protein C0991_006115 [Blastosporella zonata]|nr:hypothetical protein C0991_006115 [Blastosporella zonata]
MFKKIFLLDSINNLHYLHGQKAHASCVVRRAYATQIREWRFAAITRAHPGVEHPDGYRIGGYHPVHIGDVYNRYQIINKLGYGRNSTVWLAEDKTAKQLAALKIFTHDALSSPQGLNELNVARHLRDQRKLHDGAEYVTEMLDDFEIVGPNGTHRCIVNEPLGPAPIHGSEIEEIFGEDHYIPLSTTASLLPQIARGVAHIHKCGVVHGNLRKENILLHFDMKHWTPKIAQKYLGRPRKCLLKDVSKARPADLPEYLTHRPQPDPSPHLPDYLVFNPEPLPLLQLGLSSPEKVHIKICNFGYSFLASESGPVRLPVPSEYAAPEVFYPEPDMSGMPSDVWAMGVLFYTMLFDCFIFDGLSPMLHHDANESDSEMLKQIVSALGKPPDRWWVQWQGRGEFFEEDGSVKEGTPAVDARIWDVLAGKIPEDELSYVEWLTKKMLVYEPSERITAEETTQLLPPLWWTPEEARLGHILDKFEGRTLRPPIANWKP